jgi:hypothetical protein
VTETDKLTASDAAAGDEFAYSLARGGDTVVIGAITDDDNGSNSGSAYVFVRSGTTWTEQAKLTASDAAAGDQFGQSVAVDGDTAVIGAGLDDDNGTDSGSAYVFVRTGTSWSEQAKLTAGDGVADDRFSTPVSLDGDTAVSGAHGKASASGAAYVFTRTGTSWSQQAKLTASDAAASDQFGKSITLEGETVVIAAPTDDDNGTDSGSAYVFVRTGTSWTEQTKLTASDAAGGDEFGHSDSGNALSLAGNRVVIGARRDDDTGTDSGSAYVFIRSGTTWNEQAKLTASDGAEDDFFGQSISLNGNMVAIGALMDDDDGPNSGSVYTFVRTGTSWTEQDKITASDATNGDTFGWSLALEGTSLIVGAKADDDAGSSSGSVYVLDVPTELTLDASPETVLLGETLSFTTCGGQQGGPSLFFIVAVDAVPSFAVVATIPFFSDGCWTLSGEYNEPLLTGNTVTFRTFAINVCGFLGQTNDEDVLFQ